MIDFKNFFKMPKVKPPQQAAKKPLSEVKARHLRPISRDPHTRKVHPGDFVPVMHRPVIENNKLKRIKAGKSKIETLFRSDVKEICDQFHVHPNTHKHTKLGNTGIIMRYDHFKSKFILEKPTKHE
jgi:hypothetical protein